VPLLIVQGLADTTAPPGDSCQMIVAANALSGTPDFATYHLNSSATGLTSNPTPTCPGLSWPTSPNPLGAFSGSHYFLVVDGLHHAENTGAEPACQVMTPECEVIEQTTTFLDAKTP
jgi:hypothetical protein